MSEDNRVDIWAVLRGDRTSFKRVENEISKAIHDGAKQGATDLPKVIQDQVDAAAPRIRKSVSRALDTTREVNKAKAESLRLDAESLKIAEKKRQVEKDLAERRAYSFSLSQRELEVERRKTALKAEQAVHAAKVAEQEAKVAAAQQTYRDNADYIRRGNLLMKDLRLAGDVSGAKAKDKSLQPFRKNQVGYANEVREQKAALNELVEAETRGTKAIGAAEKELSGIRAESGNNLKAIARLEDEVGKARKAGTDHTRRATAASDALGKSLRSQKEAILSVDDALKQANKTSGGHGGYGLSRNATAFGDLFRSVPGSVGGPFGAVLGPLALADMVSYGEALTTAGQALALIPAVATAAGAAIGTLALGIHGFDDVLKNLDNPKQFIAMIEKLAPSAQQAALEIQSLVQGPLGHLQRMVQEDLFKNVAPQLDSLAKTFTPALTQLTTGIATSFNHMFSSFGGALSGNKGGIAEIINNIVSAFQNLEPAVKPFTDALVTITRVGSGFLPSLAHSITDLANSFNTFIQKAAADGSLQSFMQKGVDAAKLLGEELFTLGKQLFDLFGNKSPEELRKQLDEIRDGIVTLASAVQSIAHFIHDWQTELLAVGALVVGGKLLIGLDNVLQVVGAGGILGAFGKMPAAAGAAATGVMAALGPLAAMLSDMAILAAAIYAVPKLVDPGHIDSPNPTKSVLGQIQGAHPEWGGPVSVPGMPTAPASGPEGDHWWGNAQYQDKAVPDPEQYMPKLNRQLPAGMQALPGIQIAPGAPAAAQPTAGALYPGSPGVQPHIEYGTSGAPFEKPSLGYHKVDPKELNDTAFALQNEAVNLAEANAQLAEVEKNGLATKQERLEAEQKFAQARKSFDDAQLEYTKASLGKWEKIDANMAVFGEIGAHLDKDLGFSKGLPGLADNLVKFVASLALAPAEGKLAQIASTGDGSYGLLGMAFGGYGKKGIGPAGFQNTDVGEPGALNTRVPASSWLSQTPGATGASNVVSAAHVGPDGYAGILAHDTSKSGLAQYGGIPGGPSGEGQNVLSFMQSVMNQFNQSTGSSLKVTADFPGGPTGHPDDGGDHSARRALDISGDPKQMNAFAAYVANDPQLRAVTRQLIHNPQGDTSVFNPDMNIIGGHLTNGWQTYGSGGEGMPGHADHDHWAVQSIPQMADGAQGATDALNNLATAANNAAAWAGGGSPQGGAPGGASPIGSDKGSIAKAIYGAVTGAGYSPAMGTAAVQAALKESGLDPMASNGTHNSLFQTSNDKNVNSDPQSQINWVLKEMAAHGGPAAANAADPQDWFANNIERGGYPGSDYSKFLGQAKSLIGNADDPLSHVIPGSAGKGFLGNLGGPKLGPTPGGSDLGSLLGSSDTSSGVPSSTMPFAGAPQGAPGDFTPGIAPLPGTGVMPGSQGNPKDTPFGQGLGTTGNIGQSAQQYAANPIQQADPGWQPNGGGGLGIGGLAMAGIQAGLAAAGTAGAPFGGQAAAAAAQMGIQLMNRTIAYGGQVAGIGVEGLLDTFAPSDPDTGKNPLKDSWLWRAAGALAGAAPAVGSGGAGLMDKLALKKQQDQQGQGGQQDGGTHIAGDVNNGHTINVFAQDGQSGKSIGQDAADQLMLRQAYSAQPPVGAAAGGG